MKTRTCVSPDGHFTFAIHKPEYEVDNLRQTTKTCKLGELENGSSHTNTRNFPAGNIEVENADWIYEIPNPLFFRGSTYIDKEWADNIADNLQRISLAPKDNLSLSSILKEEGISERLITKLPPPLLLALATSSTDRNDLTNLAEMSCIFTRDSSGQPSGLLYKKDNRGRIRGCINNHALFEAVANNSALPDIYKEAMVLRPGAQGGSEIVGEYKDDHSHVYEYLRTNSYIAHGHYAANMSEDSICYSIDSLKESDMTGLRHLHYQRIFVILARKLGIENITRQEQMSADELEILRRNILEKLRNNKGNEGSATLWGWNFGFDYAPTGYRLHASHQQVHQQYAMIPADVERYGKNPFVADGTMQSFACGDMINEVMMTYKAETGRDFFSDYLACIKNNARMDGRTGTDSESSLIVWEDEHALLFVPKAQTSQWELQLMALVNNEKQIVGNIVEADTDTRKSLNRGIFFAQKALAGLGARMVTSIEYSKRITAHDTGQHLLYSFLPRLPESPGAFSEAQLRYINGHYPEDFASVCRQKITRLLSR